MSFDEQIKKLKGPDLSTLELQTCLNTLHSQTPFSDTDSLRLSSVLLSKIVPQTYVLLEKQTKNVIADLLTSLVGLTQIIRLIKDQTLPLENMYILIDIFKNILQTKLPLIIQYFLDSKDLAAENWKTLLTTKLIECLGVIHLWILDHPTPSENSLRIDRTQISTIMESFTSNITKMLLEHSNTPRFAETQKNIVQYMITFYLEREPNPTFDILLENWSCTIAVFTTTNIAKSPKQKFQEAEFQKKFLMGIFNVSNKRLQDTNIPLCKSYIRFIENLLATINPTGFQTTLLEKCKYNRNITASFVWMKTLPNFDTQYLKSCLDAFGNGSYILNTPVHSQRLYTEFLLLMLMLSSTNDIREISTSSFFLNTITSRLESKSLTARELGMFIADYIYYRVNGKYMFSISSYEVNRNQFMKPLNLLFEKLNDFHGKESMDEILVAIRNDTVDTLRLQSTTGHMIVEQTPVMVNMDYNSDNEDSDLDDPSVGRKPTIAKPVFLKDLLHFLSSDPQKDTTCYEKRDIAFSIGIEMVRIKKGSPELKFYSTKLMDVALDLDSIGFPLKDNKNDGDDRVKVAFDSWKLSFMIAICTSDPDTIFNYLIDSFLKQDWPVPTRIKVLSCIGLSCRELAGKTDDFVWGKSDFDKVKPKTLAGLGHEAFLSLDDVRTSSKKIVDINEAEREQRLVRALESVDINEGKVLHRSKKLDIDSQEKLKQSTRVVYTTFINKTLPKWFFSLTSVWQEVNTLTYGAGFKVGTMSDYLNGHYIEILSMIYACGVPSCIQLIDMSVEEIQILIGIFTTLQTSAKEEFPVLLLKSAINSIRSLLTDNERTWSVLKSTALLEITTLAESYASILQIAPTLDEPTNALSQLLLQQLQQYSFMYSS